MRWLQKLMNGRYGMDELGYALIGGYFLFSLLFRLTGSDLFLFGSILGLLWEVYRLFSRKVGQRRRENDRFAKVVSPLLRKIHFLCRCIKDHEHTYFKCPCCGQQLRVPKQKGKIVVTCRNCKANFEKKV